MENMRRCAHPAGCEMPADEGNIYCEGCATDPVLREDDAERDDVEIMQAENDREENRCPNPQGAQFDELVKSVNSEIEHLRNTKGWDERRARDHAIEGHCEGYELSASAEALLGAAICEKRGVC